MKTGDGKKDPAAVALGSRGGLKRRLHPERKELARLAGLASGRARRERAEERQRVARLEKLAEALRR